MSEKKTDKKVLVLGSMVCLIPMLAGVILYAKLPDTIATHWDATGAVNGTSSKFIGIIVYPGILIAINLLIQPIMRMDPKYANMGEKIKLCVQWIIPAVSVVCSGMTLSHALGISIPVQVIAPMLCGLILLWSVIICRRLSRAICLESGFHGRSTVKITGKKRIV